MRLAGRLKKERAVKGLGLNARAKLPETYIGGYHVKAIPGPYFRNTARNRK